MKVLSEDLCRKLLNKSGGELLEWIDLDVLYFLFYLKASRLL